MKRLTAHIFGSVLACGLVPVSQAASQIMDLGTSGSYRLAATSGAAVYRVGNAVMLRIAVMPKGYGNFVSQVLLACDGSWVTSGFQTHFESEKQPSAQELFDKAKAEDEAVPLDAISMLSPDEGNPFYGKLLARRAAELCRGASKEPKNVLIPVATAGDGDDMGQSFAIVLGTATRSPNEIDLWSRNTTYKLQPILLTNGQPFEIKGKAQTKMVATGKYSLDHQVFNCKKRSIATFETVEYDGKSSTPKSRSLPRDRVSLVSVVPGSVGEAQLEMVCALYGGK